MSEFIAWSGRNELDFKVNLIAEIGINHNGDMSLAKDMILSAKDCGADFVKFQSWQEKKLKHGPWDDGETFCSFDNKRDFYKSVELSDDQHVELVNFCNNNGVKFLTTCFDVGRIDFLNSLGMEYIKIASSDAFNFDLLEAVSKKFKKIIISVGMLNKDEIIKLNDFLFYNIGSFNKDIVILHCVSNYPAKRCDFNVNKFMYIKNNIVKNNTNNYSGFGLSDHTDSIDTSVFAVSNGANWIEKHFTLDKSSVGPDNVFSLEPVQLKQLRTYCDYYTEIMSKYVGNVIDGDYFEVNDAEVELSKVVRGRFE